MDPVTAAAGLIIAGGVVFAVGQLWLLVVLAKASRNWLLAGLLTFGIGDLVFLFKFPSKAWKPFLTRLIGGVALAGGALLSSHALTTGHFVFRDRQERFEIQFPRRWGVPSVSDQDVGVIVEVGRDSDVLNALVGCVPKSESDATSLSQFAREAATGGETELDGPIEALVDGHRALRYELRDDAGYVTGVFTEDGSYYYSLWFGLTTKSTPEHERELEVALASFRLLSGPGPLEEPLAGDPQPATRSLAELLELAASGDEASRLDAVQDWREQGLDAEPNARRDMLAALGSPLESAVRAQLLNSFQRHPPACAEVLAIVESADLDDGLRRALLARLLEDPDADPDAVAQTLSDLDDTPDLLIEEVLLRLDRARADALARLVSNRGVDWAWSPEGRPALDACRGDVAQARPLAASEQPAERALACELLASGDPDRAALELLLGLLRDDELDVRRRAAAALEARADARVTFSLALALEREEDETLRATLTRTFEKLPGQDSAPLLEKLYAKGTPEAERAAILGARASQQLEALPLLFTALDNQTPALVVEALRALEGLAKVRALEPHIQRSGHKLLALAREAQDPEVRKVAKVTAYRVTGRLPR